MQKFKRPANQISRGDSNTQVALNKIFRYCAYQERSHREVRNKLSDYGLRTAEVDEILAYLITEGFLNEERYAKAFAGGKFRIMKWGKLKIQRELESSGVSPRNITKAIAEIDSSEYSRTLIGLVRKKSSQVADEHAFKRKGKVALFVIGKGYEPELVWEAVNDLLE